VLGTKGRRVTKVKIVRESGPDASGPRSDHLEAVRGESERSRRESRESRETRSGREPQTQDRAQARDHIAERLR
jgi:hypothetical protein